MDIRDSEKGTGKPMIENSDRGITLNKSLAWTMLSALVFLIWWGGGTLANLQSATVNLTSTLTENKAAIMAVEQRVRALENTQTRVDAQFGAMRDSLDEIKEQNRAIEALVRQYLQTSRP